MIANEPALVVTLLSWRNQLLQSAGAVVGMHLKPICLRHLLNQRDNIIPLRINPCVMRTPFCRYKSGLGGCFLQIDFLR